MLNIDYRALISRSDLVYLSPPEVPMEGTPIGNGNMGMTIWPTEHSIRTQINRNDVFSSDRNHAGSHRNSIDFRGPCAQIEIDLGASVFNSDNFRNGSRPTPIHCSKKRSNFTAI